jgi:hypothetical protein
LHSQRLAEHLSNIDNFILPSIYFCKIHGKTMRISLFYLGYVFLFSISCSALQFNEIAIKNTKKEEVFGNPGKEAGLQTPTSFPSSLPSGSPTLHPSSIPSSQPSSVPTCEPTQQPSTEPSSQPTSAPSVIASSAPTIYVTRTDSPSSVPSGFPSCQPTIQPSRLPTSQPSGSPTSVPSNQPSSQPSSSPSGVPTSMPSPGGELGVDWWYTVTARCDYDVDTVGEYTRDEMLDALTYTFEFVVTDDLDETERDRVEVAVEWKDIPSNKVTDENEYVVKIIAWCPDHATAVKVLHEFFFFVIIFPSPNSPEGYIHITCRC